MIQDRTCLTCGAVFQGGPRAYYCPACRYVRTRKTNAAYRKRASEGKTRVGKQDVCERCGSAYTVNAGLQRFCAACQKEHRQEYDRVTALDYYKAHRDRINPPRNVRRRIGPKACIVCGKEFKVPTCNITCSPECRRKWINMLWRTRYYPMLRSKKKGK